MILNNGDKILVAHRRLFEKDPTRFFIGAVLAYEDGIAKVEGHTYVKDLFTGEFPEKQGARTKIFSISSGTLIIYQLPQNTQMESIKFEVDSRGSIVITDSSSFCMDVSETPHERR